MTLYKVIEWGTNKVLLETTHLPSAKRAARNRGHTGNPFGKFYAPIARVDEPMKDGSGCYGTVYNPVFRVGQHDDFRPVPLVHVQPGPRKCSHGKMSGCSAGCN